MHKDILLAPLDWPLFVEETLRRRKELKISQKKHAALAGVSIPTMISFEKAETTLSMQKVLSILDVVSLAARENIPKDELSLFAEESHKKWFSLVQDLPQELSAVKHLHGYYSYSYVVKDSLENNRSITSDKLLKYIEKASKPVMNNRPIFSIPKDELIYKEPGFIECWYKDHIFNDTKHSDFWRVKHSLLSESLLFMHLHRGYDEDSMENIGPGKIFDLTLPIFRTGEVILHASQMARLMVKNPENVTIEVQAVYTGLRGRELFSMENIFYEKLVSEQNMVDLSIEFKLSEIDNLTEITYEFLIQLYNKFNFFKLSKSLVESKLSKL